MRRRLEIIGGGGIARLGDGAGLYAFGGGTAAAVPWYLAGGVAAANCVAAYKPQAAVSLDASYINLVTPGTYNAAPGVAPTFNALTGWTFDGATQYLTTGIVPANTNWSAVVRFSGGRSSGYNTVFGSYGAGSTRFYIDPWSNGNLITYGHGAYLQTAFPSGLTSGVLGFAGRTAYKNGTANGAITDGSPTTYPIAIGGNNASGAYSAGFLGNILAFAVYNSTLSAEQMLAISQAMLF